MSRADFDSQLIHKNEKLYFTLCVIFSVIGYLYLIVSIVGILIIAILMGASLFFHALQMAYIRKNGVRITNRQFPHVYEKVKSLSEQMGLATIPDVFVMESSGILNAFATRFFGRNMVVLYSDIFDLTNRNADDELNFVIAHELAHIKRNHISKQLLILPARWIPFLSEAYSRSCEYTCDRMAAFVTQNKEAAMNGLTILAIGKELYLQVDRQEYLYQCSQETGFFVWLSEHLSTHPPLPQRIHEIAIFFPGSVITKQPTPLNG